MQAWKLTHEELNQQAHLWVYPTFRSGARVMVASVMVPAGDDAFDEHTLMDGWGKYKSPVDGVEEGHYPLSLMAREVWKWHLVQVSDAVEAGEPVPFRVVASFRFDPVLGCETRLWARCVADGVSAGGGLNEEAPNA